MFPDFSADYREHRLQRARRSLYNPAEIGVLLFGNAFIVAILGPCILFSI